MDKDYLAKLGEAEKKYVEEFIKMSKDFNELKEYIQPFISQNEKYKKILENISTQMLCLPVSYLVISTIHFTQISTMRNLQKSLIPPEKIICKKCNTVVYDFTEIKEFFDKEK